MRKLQIFLSIISPCRHTRKLTLARCRGVRRIHLDSNMPAREQAPGSQFGPDVHGSLLRAKFEVSSVFNFFTKLKFLHTFTITNNKRSFRVI